MAGKSSAERMRKSRANRTEEQKLIDKEKNKECMRNLRMKKKGDPEWKKREKEAGKLRMRKMRLKQKLESSETVTAASLKKAYSVIYKGVYQSGKSRKSPKIQEIEKRSRKSPKSQDIWAEVNSIMAGVNSIMAGKSAAERKRKSRANRTEEQKLIEREKNKECMRNLRMKKKGDAEWKKREKEAGKLRMRKMGLKQKLGSSATVTSTSPKKAYSSSQSFVNALKRIKSTMPKNP